MTPAELLARRQCFEKAYEFVGSVPSGGISAFFKHSHGAILVAQEQIQKWLKRSGNLRCFVTLDCHFRWFWWKILWFELYIAKRYFTAEKVGYLMFND